jgi:predicted metalloprotease
LELSAQVQSDIRLKSAQRKARLRELEAARLVYEEAGTARPKEDEQEVAKLENEEIHGLGLEDYATEAAFALQAIYVAVGNQRAATEIGEKWLVL